MASSDNDQEEILTWEDGAGFDLIAEQDSVEGSRGWPAAAHRNHVGGGACAADEPRGFEMGRLDLSIMPFSSDDPAWAAVGRRRLPSHRVWKRAGWLNGAEGAFQAPLPK